MLRPRRSFCKVLSNLQQNYKKTFIVPNILLGNEKYHRINLTDSSKISVRFYGRSQKIVKVAQELET